MSLSDDEERRASRIGLLAGISLAVSVLIGMPAWELHWPGRYVLLLWCYISLVATLLSAVSYSSRKMDVSPQEWWSSGRERLLAPIRTLWQGRGVGRFRVIVDVPLAFGGLAMFWIAACTVSGWRHLRGQ